MRYVVGYDVKEVYCEQYVQLEEGESTCRDNILVNFWHGTDHLPEDVEILTITKVEV